MAVNVDGFKLEFPADVVSRITDVDIAIESISKNAGIAASGIGKISAALGGIDASNIQAVAAAMESIANNKAGVGMSKMKEDAIEMCKQVTDMVDKLSRISISGVRSAVTSAATSAPATVQATSAKSFVYAGDIDLNKQARDIISALNKESNKMEKTMLRLEAASIKYGLSVSDLGAKLNELREQQLRYNREAQQLAQQNVGTAISDAKSATTLRQMEQSLKRLKQTMDNLNPNDPRWKAANQTYKETKERIDKVRKAMGDLQQKQNSILSTTDQLARKVALLFSVSAIQNWIEKMVDVRAKFELQRVALGAILQDTERANQVFTEIQQMALVSPFTIMQLEKATKQVAAFGVEADKLKPTVKMLSDMSAGLGVDVQRLILVFGHMKARNYLEGTMVRQFTNAGFNVLGELAKYYTEIENKMVSVANVQERVKKKMVTFEDVEEVLRRVTSQGGMFYDMQAKQADSLWGQMQRIGDAYDLMLNDIGKSSQGIISWLLQLVRETIQNWREVALWVEYAGKAYLVFMAIQKRAIIISAIQKLAGVWGLLRKEIVSTSAAASLSTFMQTDAIGKLSMATNGAITAFKGLKVAMKAALNATIITAIVVALYEVAQSFMDAKAKADQLAEAMQNISEETAKSKNESIGSYERLARIIADSTKSYEEQKDAIEEMNRTFGDILPQELRSLEYVKGHSGQWDEATQKIREYYNVLATEKQKNAVMEKYQSDIQKAKKDIVENTMNALPELGIDKNQYNAFADEIVKGMIDGTIKNAREGLEEFKRLIENYIGKELTDTQELSLFRDVGSARFSKNLHDIFNTTSDLRGELSEITDLSGVFATAQEKAAAEATIAINKQVEAVKKVADQYNNSLKDINSIQQQISRAQMLPDSEEKTKQIAELTRQLELAKVTTKELSDAMNIPLPDFDQLGDMIYLEQQMAEGGVAISNAFKNGANPELIKYYTTYMQLNKVLEAINTGMEDGEKIDKKRMNELRSSAYTLKSEIQSISKRLGLEIDNDIMETAKSPQKIHDAFKIAWDQTEKDFKTKVHDRIIDYTNNLVKGVASLLGKIGINIEFKEDKQGEKQAEATIDKIVERNRKLVDRVKESVGAQASVLIEAGQNTQDYAQILKKNYEDRIKEVEKYDKAVAKGQEAEYLRLNNLTKAQIEYKRKVAEADKEVAELYDPTIFEKKGKGETGRDTTEEDARRRFDFFKRANAEYEKLLKWYGKEEAQLKIINDMRREAETLNVSKIFSAATFDKAGTIKSIDELYNTIYASSKKHAPKIKQEAEKIISPLQVEIDFAIQQQELEQVSMMLDELFGGYELYLELDKLGIDKSYMSDLFGVDAFSLDEVQAKLDKAFVELMNKQEQRTNGLNAKVYNSVTEAYKHAGDEERKFYDNNQKKITDNFRKEMKERLKEYSKYLVQAYSEAGQIRLKVAQDLANISTLKTQDGKDIDEQTKALMRQGVMRDAQKALDKQAWEDFKASEIYEQMFADIEKASTTTLKMMQQRLEGVRSRLKNLDPSELKEIYGQIKKIDDIIKSRNPFKTLVDAFKGFGNVRKNVKEAEEELINYQKELDDLEARRRELEAELALMTSDGYVNAIKRQEELRRLIVEEKKKGDDADKNIIDKYDEENRKLEEQIRLLKEAAGLKEGSLISIDADSVSRTKTELSNINEQIGNTNGKITKANSKAQEGNTKAAAIRQSMKEIDEHVQRIVGGISDAVDGLTKMGVLSDEQAEDFSDYVQVFQDFNGAAQEAGEAVASYYSGDIMGMISHGVSAIGKTIKGIGDIVGIGDKKKEREIQKQEKLINRLQRAYEQLGDAIRDAYSFDQLAAATGQSIENINAQISAYRKMIDAESAKKKNSKDKLEEYKNAIEDLERQRVKLQQDMINEMGGLATGDAIKSAAQNFVDAWLNAYKETGDGLSGLEDKFDEFFVDLVKKQMVSKIADTYISKWAQSLNKALENDNTIDKAEMTELYKKAEEMLPGMSELMKNIVDMLQNATGIDVTADGSTSKLSGLAKGIQGVTEDTALVLEALLNSIRYYVSDTNTQVRGMLDEIKNLINPPADNLFLSELRLQTAELRAMNRLLNSVTKAGHPQGGSGLKVFMN